MNVDGRTMLRRKPINYPQLLRLKRRNLATNNGLVVVAMGRRRLVL